MSEPITITLSFVFDDHGEQICNRRRRQTYDARADGVLLVRNSATPLRDACRRLLRDGLDPGTEVILRHAGDHSGSELRTTLRAAAELSPLGRCA